MEGARGRGGASGLAHKEGTYPNPFQPCALEQLDDLVVQAPLLGHSKEHVFSPNAIAPLPSVCRVSHDQRRESREESVCKLLARDTRPADWANEEARAIRSISRSSKKN